MHTYDRRDFVPQAIDCFLRQDYLGLELIVVDDGSDPVADLLPDDRRVRYFRGMILQAAKSRIDPGRPSLCGRSSSP
jgi:hypothetical protein